MIISLTGDLGSGKSTVAKIIVQKLNLKHYSSGDLFRKIAKENNVDFMQLNKNSEASDELDKKIDAYVENLGKTGDNFIIDSRLAWHFIPNSFKVYLKVDPIIGAKRILGNKREEESAESVEQMAEKNKARRDSENKRYKEYYNLDMSNMDQYDLVVDTSNINAEQVAQKILDNLPK